MTKLSITNLKSALVTAIITAIFSMLIYVVGVGDIFKIDTHSLANIGVISLFTALISSMKSFFTTKSGKFLGLVQVVEK